MQTTVPKDKIQINLSELLQLVRSIWFTSPAAFCPAVFVDTWIQLYKKAERDFSYAIVSSSTEFRGFNLPHSLSPALFSVKRMLWTLAVCPQNLSILKDSNSYTTSRYQTSLSPLMIYGGWKKYIFPLFSKNIMPCFFTRQKINLTETITNWLHIKAQNGYIQSAAKAECKWIKIEALSSSNFELL